MTDRTESTFPQMISTIMDAGSAIVIFVHRDVTHWTRGHHCRHGIAAVCSALRRLRRCGLILLTSTDQENTVAAGAA